MDVKQAIRDVAWMSRMAPAASQDDIFKKSIRNSKITKQLDAIDHWADMAEAALAYVEWQIDNGVDVPMDGATYMREREKLWDAFIVARDRAKEVANEST